MAGHWGIASWWRGMNFAYSCARIAVNRRCRLSGRARPAAQHLIAVIKLDPPVVGRSSSYDPTSVQDVELPSLDDFRTAAVGGRRKLALAVLPPPGRIGITVFRAGADRGGPPVQASCGSRTGMPRLNRSGRTEFQEKGRERTARGFPPAGRPSWRPVSTALAAGGAGHGTSAGTP